LLFDQEVSFQYCCEFVRCWRNEPKKSFVILRKIGFMVGRTLRGGARMRYRGATRLARSRGEEQSRLWQGLPYLLLGGIHQPELSADVCGLGSERGTVVPGKVAYRTFLHVGTVRRDHSLRWQQSVYVGDFPGEFRDFRRVSASKAGLDPLSGDLRHSPRGLS